MNRVEVSVKDIIERIKTAAGLSSDAAFAERIGVSKQAVTNWKHRNSIDFVLVLSCFRELDYNYIVYGDISNCLPASTIANNSIQDNSNQYREILKTKDEHIELLKTQLKYTSEMMEYFRNKTDKLESLQFSTIETGNESLNNARSGQGSLRTLTSEKISDKMESAATV